MVIFVPSHKFWIYTIDYNILIHNIILVFWHDPDNFVYIYFNFIMYSVYTLFYVLFV